MAIKTLLVVEQSAQMRRLIRMLLGGQVEQVVECTEGSEALAAYANCRPDWVLLDINTRAADAISITRQINELFPDAYITILADYDDPDIREAVYRAGASGYLIKDNLSSLRDLLAERLSRHDARRPQ
jgi:DNA-binding NarL/FixJ family response regulator